MGVIIFSYIVVIERLINLCFSDWKVFCFVYYFIMFFYIKLFYVLRLWKQIVRDLLEFDLNSYLKFIILIFLGYYILFEEKVGGIEI